MTMINSLKLICVFHTQINHGPGAEEARQRLKERRQPRARTLQKCHYCEKSYWSLSGLGKHVRKIHSESSWQRQMAASGISPRQKNVESDHPEGMSIQSFSQENVRGAIQESGQQSYCSEKSGLLNSIDVQNSQSGGIDTTKVGHFRNGENDALGVIPEESIPKLVDKEYLHSGDRRKFRMRYRKLHPGGSTQQQKSRQADSHNVCTKNIERDNPQMKGQQSSNQVNKRDNLQERNRQHFTEKDPRSDHAAVQNNQSVQKVSEVNQLKHAENDTFGALPQEISDLSSLVPGLPNNPFNMWESDLSNLANQEKQTSFYHDTNVMKSQYLSESSEPPLQSVTHESNQRENKRDIASSSTDDLIGNQGVTIVTQQSQIETSLESKPSGLEYLEGQNETVEQLPTKIEDIKIEVPEIDVVLHFDCLLCNRKYKSKTALRNHQRKAHSEDIKIEVVDSLEETIKIEAPETDVVLYFDCLLCNRKYKSKNALRNHQRKAHRTGPVNAKFRRNKNNQKSKNGKGKKKQEKARDMKEETDLEQLTCIVCGHVAKTGRLYILL